MANVTYDKKQLPQVIGLGVLSLGIFGWFTAKLVLPPAAQASAPKASTPAATATTDAPATADAATQPSDDEIAASLIGASAPSDAMRDPFEPYTSPVPPAPPAPGVKPGAPAPGVPSVPGLPGAGDVAPLAPGPVDGGWMVYGVICSDADPSAALAIFRRGEERRYVRLGELVDEDTRLIGVDRSGVTVIRFGNRVRLGLGGPQPETKAPAMPVSGSTSAPINAAPTVLPSGSLADAVKAALSNSTGTANTGNSPAAAPAAPSATSPAPTLPAGTRPI